MREDWFTESGAPHELGMERQVAWSRPDAQCEMATPPTSITGKPQLRYTSTSYIERQNLTIRMQACRFTRLTNAFSKKLEDLKAQVALHFACYNFMKVHGTLRCTPAMEAGITDHTWTLEELLRGSTA
jgi:hypothetical protein